MLPEGSTLPLAEFVDRAKWLAIVALAIALDRITQAYGRRAPGAAGGPAG